ncbi:MAG: Hsp20/alpha crystallin family protein [Burkholderiales bacterium]
MKLDNLKESFGTLWGSVADGWRHLWQSAAGALTRFKPGEKTDLPAPAEVDDASYLPGRSWAMLGGDVFEDDKRLVVRLEIPGVQKENINIELLDDSLVVSGEKRFEREETQGRWRVMQCAYGSFRRVVPLPARVKAESARARYRNGVLRVEMLKATPSRPRAVTIKVS